MNNQVYFKVKANPVIKAEAQMIFEDIGLDLNSAVNVFLHKVVQTGGIPFDLRAEIPNAETRAAIENAENGIGLSRPFSSVAELREDLNADDPV